MKNIYYATRTFHMALSFHENVHSKNFLWQSVNDSDHCNHNSLCWDSQEHTMGENTMCGSISPQQWGHSPWNTGLLFSHSWLPKKTEFHIFNIQWIPNM
jgi:hypothetical protein